MDKTQSMCLLLYNDSNKIIHGINFGHSFISLQRNPFVNCNGTEKALVIITELEAVDRFGWFAILILIQNSI